MKEEKRKLCRKGVVAAVVLTLLAGILIPSIQMASAYTPGSVLFGGGGGGIAEDNSNFFWDDGNNRLGIGTGTPVTDVHFNELTTHTAGWGHDPAHFTYIDTVWNPPAPASGTELVSVYSIAETHASASQINGNIYGYFGGAKHQSTNSINGVVGIYGRTWSTTGTVDVARAVVADVRNQGGTMTTAKGVHVMTTNLAGTIGTAYGIHVEDISIWGTTNYALLTEGGDVVFNEKGKASDFRVESTNKAKALFVDGGGDGVTLTAPNTALADGVLENNNIHFYLDEGTNTLKVKVKYSTGTIKTGEITLT